MAGSRTFWREKDNGSDNMRAPSIKNSVFDPTLRSISGVRCVVTYTDGPKRSFGLAWSLTTDRVFISGWLMTKSECKSLKEGDWIEAVVVWMHDNWVVRSCFPIQPLVETKVIHVGYNVLLEVHTKVVIGAVLAKHAVCYSAVFGRVILHYESRGSLGKKLEWGAAFNATLSKPRDPDEYGCVWTVTKLLDRCQAQRPLPLTIRFVHATVGDFVNDTSCSMVTDDGDPLVFESFVFVGASKPKHGDRIEAYVCRDTGDKMRAVGVRPMEKCANGPLGTVSSATTADDLDEDAAQLLDDLEEMCSDCSTGDVSSDEKVEPEYSHTSGSLNNQQNISSRPIVSSNGNGNADEVNSQKMAYNGSSGSQTEETRSAGGEHVEERSTSQMGAFASSKEVSEQLCRAKDLLKRVMVCKGVVELIASEDPLLMRDIYFFDRHQ